MHHADAALGAQMDFRIGELGHVHRDQAVVDQAQAIQPRQRALAVLLDRIGHFLRGFVRMQMHGDVELVGQHAHAFEVGIVDGVRRMRGERGTDQRIVAPLVVQLAGTREVFIVRRCPCSREIDDHRAHQRAETMLLVDGRLHIGEEVVFVDAGRTAAQHFGNCQRGAISYEFRPDHRRFHRPDVLLQPHHQRQVVGDAAQQRHRIMRMRIDQAGHQRSIGPRHGLLGRKTRARVGNRQHGNDDAVTDGHRVVFQHHRMRFDRHDIAGLNQQVAGFGRGIGHEWIH